MKEMIFVCTGNTCRSPMAEAFGKKFLPKDIHIFSRGLSVSYQEGANSKSIKTMAAEGLDISDHVAVQFDIGEVTPDTVILCMTHGHKDYLVAYYPEIRNRVFTLMEYAGLAGEVTDPYGSEQEVYDACGKLIKNAIIRIKNHKIGKR